MFVTNKNIKDSIDIYNCDISLHDGVPRQYNHLKNKKFSDWEIVPWELFIFKDKLIGQGSFANVYLAKWRETTVVAKVIVPNIAANEKALVMREFDIMAKLHHPNIVQFLGYIDDPLIIVMEYIPNGNLLSNLEKLKSKERISIMKDILKGLAYIHNRKPACLIHRDIKLTNILLTNSKVAKITDFGLSKFYIENKLSNQNLLSLNEVHDENENSILPIKITDEKDQLLDKLKDNDLTKNVGTERYMAPEIKLTTLYNYKVDIYSAGIVLYELFEKKILLNQKNLNWYYTPKSIKNLIINNMLNENFCDRLDSLQLIAMINKLGY